MRINKPHSQSRQILNINQTNGLTSTAALLPLFAADVLLPPPLLLPFPDALADGFTARLSPSSVTAIRLTWISLSPSSPSLFKEGRGSEREGQTISASASASASSLCSGVWECWWLSREESRGKERSHAEQLN